jgi:hypothetical protein
MSRPTLKGDHVELTEAQRERLEVLDEAARVVGVDQDCPVLRHPSGRVVRLLASGRTCPVRAVVLDDLSERAA